MTSKERQQKAIETIKRAAMDCCPCDEGVGAALVKAVEHVGVGLDDLDKADVLEEIAAKFAVSP
jgi:hypothetical protein